jgi:hypothetical protein
VSLPCDPVLSPGEIQMKTQTALFRVVEERGIERRWERLLYGRMRALGLVDVRAEARLSMWHGGSAGASLTRANFEQLHNALIAGGLVSEEDCSKTLQGLTIQTSQRRHRSCGRRRDAVRKHSCCLVWILCARS